MLATINYLYQNSYYDEYIHKANLKKDFCKYSEIKIER